MIDYLQGLHHLIVWLEPAVGRRTRCMPLRSSTQRSCRFPASAWDMTSTPRMRCITSTSIYMLGTTCLETEDHVCEAVKALIAFIGRNHETAPGENLEVLSSSITSCFTRNECMDGRCRFLHSGFTGAETL